MYKVKDIAEELQVSRPTVYNHLKKLKKDIKPFMYKKKGMTYLEPEGLELIKESINGTTDYKENLKAESDRQDIDPETKELLSNLNSKIDSLENEYIASLKQQIDRLQDELDRKNSQFENFQILLKQNQERILELESETDQENVGLWQKIKGIFK